MRRLRVTFILWAVLACLHPWVATQVAADAPGERQGGESIGTSVVIWALPFQGGGTTEGYANDYDEQCPDPSSSPDVVYSFDSGRSYDALSIDLCGSGYDTKVYVYVIVQADTMVVACNDDYPCDGGDGRSQQSRIDNIHLEPCTVYYIVIDGGNGESGSYDTYMWETTGACCLSSGACTVSTEVRCEGEWQGPDTVCEPNPCDPTASEPGSWGTIKTHFERR